jgi:hypothetical protein
MVQCCIENKMIINRNTFVTTAIERYHKLSSLEITDIALLATSLLECMIRNNDSKLSTIGKNVIVTMGKRGVLWVGPSMNFQDISSFQKNHLRVIHINESISWMHLPASTRLPTDKLTNTSGAGDALLAGLITSMISSTEKRKNDIEVSSTISKTLLLRPENLLDGINSATSHLLRINNIII